MAAAQKTERMMTVFNKEYKKALDGINPSAEALERTRNAMRAEADRSNAHYGIVIRRAIAACACMVLFTVGFFAISNRNDGSDHYGGTEGIFNENATDAGDTVGNGREEDKNEEMLDSVSGTYNEDENAEDSRGEICEDENDGIASPGDFSDTAESVTSEQEPSTDTDSEVSIIDIGLNESLCMEGCFEIIEYIFNADEEDIHEEGVNNYMISFKYSGKVYFTKVKGVLTAFNELMDGKFYISEEDLGDISTDYIGIITEKTSGVIVYTEMFSYDSNLTLPFYRFAAQSGDKTVFCYVPAISRQDICDALIG